MSTLREIANRLRSSRRVALPLVNDGLADFTPPQV